MLFNIHHAKFMCAHCFHVWNDHIMRDALQYYNASRIKEFSIKQL